MTDNPAATGPCPTCGDTGLIHGPGQNGNWTGDVCGCPAGDGDEEPLMSDEIYTGPGDDVEVAADYLPEEMAAAVLAMYAEVVAARAKLAELARVHCRYDINGLSYCADHDGHNQWVPYPCAVRLCVDGASAS